jgi:hypothetical protein
MIFQTPHLRRERGFLHFGFPDEDENVEIQDTTPSDARPDIMKKAAHNRRYNRVFKDQPPKR